MEANLDWEEAVRSMAYRIYEEEGCPLGKEAEHWSRAERLIQEQRVPLPGLTPKEVRSAGESPG